MSQGNDFDAVRAYLDFWGEHPRRAKAMAALARIEAALRVFANVGLFGDWPNSMQVLLTFYEPNGMRSTGALLAGDFRTAAARFEES